MSLAQVGLNNVEHTLNMVLVIVRFFVCTYHERALTSQHPTFTHDGHNAMQLANDDDNRDDHAGHDDENGDCKHADHDSVLMIIKRINMMNL